MRERSHWNDAEVDRVLSTDEEVRPSEGFAASVLRAVEREAALRASLAVEPSISFPWHIFLPGMAFCLALPCFMLVLALRDSASASMQVQIQIHWVQVSTMLAERYADLMTHLPEDLQQVGVEVAHHAVQMGAGWVLFALVLSWASVQWSVRA